MPVSRNRPSAPPAPLPWGGRNSWLVAGLIAGAVLLAYANCFQVPLLLDDLPAVTNNDSIRHLSDLGQVLSPPENTGPSGRPLLNLSFAISYALGGEHVLGYHIFNVGFHLVAALLLFGLLRRLLTGPLLAPTFGSRAGLLAGAIALLWSVHPALTEAVTYISQRAEILMGVFYLLAAYGLVRGAAAGSQGRAWLALSATACWLGMATKEAMATAPFVLFMLDAFLLAGSFRKAWSARMGYYVALAASWLLLGFLMTYVGHHTVGFEEGIGPWTYLMTECLAIGHYLKIAFWPHPLLFDFGPVFVHHPLSVLPQAILILALLAGTTVALLKRPALGFAGLWFFVILSPTSSFIPVALQPMAESRTYLPLMAVLSVVVLTAYAYLGRRVLAAVGIFALIGVALSLNRNQVYRSDRSVWLDTVAKAPINSRARNNLGLSYATAGEFPAALAQYKIAEQLSPRTATIHYNLGKTEAALGDTSAAIASYRRAIDLYPAYSDARVALATTLAGSGQTAAARQQLEEAVRLKPDDFQAHYNLGLTLLNSGQQPASLAEFQRALVLNPAAVEARDALATALFQLGHPEQAIDEYGRGLAQSPRSASLHNNLGNVLLATGQLAEAKRHFETALAIKPAYAQAETGLGLACFGMNRVGEAKGHLETALRLDPQNAEAHFRLGDIAAMGGDLPAAVAEWQVSLRLRPQDAEAHNNLATAYAQLGRTEEAIAEYREAVRLKPNYDRARANLDDLLAHRGAR